jgi:regulatory protein
MKDKSKISPAEALSKLQKICSTQEKCPAEVVLLLNRWGIDRNHHSGIIDHLKLENFINEHRYAGAFVKDKIHFDHWGTIKISYLLKQKGIPAGVIKEALGGIDPDVYKEMIRKEMERKRKTLKGTQYEKWAKLARYGASRGYEMEYMQDILDEIDPDV